MKTILWMPEGNPTVTRLGLVEIEPGEEMTPEQHEATVTWRLQDLIDQSQLTLNGLENLIDNSMTPEGWQVPVENLESAAFDIMANLADKLRMDGALISETVMIPTQEREGNRDLWEEMDVESWLNRASMPPL
jgi:hypothetical protein